MISRLDRLTQTEAEIMLPAEPNDSVRLKLSACENADVGNFGYEQLAVFVENGMVGTNSLAVQGKHTIEGGYQTFTPYFPFEKGMTYVVRTRHPDSESEYVFHPFQLKGEPVVDRAKVLCIYPTADQLPENLLRFYIYFNTPMEKGEALTHIHLIDAAGKVDHQAFMEFKQGLWSPDGKRLTILFDPGRIKRGVSTNLELGPALLEGGRYRLIVSPDWQDVYGQPLSKEATKEFGVDKAYRHRLTVNRLQINKPKTNSFEPLNIGFDRVIDHALVQSMVHVNERTDLIAGHWECLDQERLIRFIPEQKWQEGTYQIVFDSRLEDVAGNNLQALLDQIGMYDEIYFAPHQTIDFKL